MPPWTISQNKTSKAGPQRPVPSHTLRAPGTLGANTREPVSSSEATSFCSSVWTVTATSCHVLPQRPPHCCSGPQASWPPHPSTRGKSPRFRKTFPLCRAHLQMLTPSQDKTKETFKYVFIPYQITVSPLRVPCLGTLIPETKARWQSCTILPFYKRL